MRFYPRHLRPVAGTPLSSQPGPEHRQAADKPPRKTTTTRSSATPSPRRSPGSRRPRSRCPMASSPSARAAAKSGWSQNALDRRSQEGQVRALSPTACTRFLGLACKDGWLYVTQRPRRVAHQGQQRRRQGRCLRDRHRRLGDQRRLSRIRLRLALRQKRQLVGHPVPDGSFNSNSKFRGWAMQVTPEGKFIPTCQRRAFAGRHRLECRGRRFLHRQPRPVERHLRPQTSQGRRLHGPSRQLQMVQRAKKLATSARRRVPKSNSRMHDRSQKIPATTCRRPSSSPTARWANPPAASTATCPAASSARSRNSSSSAIRRTAPSCASTWRRSTAAIKEPASRSARASAPATCRCASATDGSLIRRRHQPRLGLARHQTVRPRTAGLDRQGAFRDPRNARQARRLRADLHASRSIRRRPAIPKSYEMKTFTYIYRADYGSPEVDHTTPTITKVTVGADGKSVRLYVSSLQEGHIHDLTAARRAFGRTASRCCTRRRITR